MLTMLLAGDVLLVSGIGGVGRDLWERGERWRARRGAGCPRSRQEGKRRVSVHLQGPGSRAGALVPPSTYHPPGFPHRSALWIAQEQQ